MTAIAVGRDGIVGTGDLDELGFTDSMRHWMVASGRLERMTHGVYRFVGSPPTTRQRLRIGLLRLGDRSWVSYEAAGALHGLDRCRRDAVEFTVPRGRRPRVDFTVHTTRFVSPVDWVEVDGMRAMSATRTIIDLAHSRWPRWKVEAAMDSAVRLGLSHPTVLEKRLTTLRGSGRWGVATIERLLPDSGGHSPLERSFLRIVREAGLASPRLQAVQRDAAGRHVARVDFLFEDHGLVVEVTGRLGHVSDAERTRDAQRRNELQDLGMTVIEYTSTRIRDDEHGVRADLLRRLTSAASS